MIIFPGNRINKKQKINQRRGTNREIEGRFDLTLECIRRHYLRRTSLLTDTLALCTDFFDLFGVLRGYIDLFMLQDLVKGDYGAIHFFLEPGEFTTRPLPTSLPDYKRYRKASLAFVRTERQDR